MSEPLKEVYPKLEKRYKKYQRFAKPKRWLWNSIIWVYFLAIITITLLNILGFMINLLYANAIFFIWFAFVWLLSRYLDRKIRVFRLNADESVMFHLCSVYDNIKNYFSNQKPELRKEYKKTALFHAKQLLLVIENHWDIGDFKLGQKVIGKSIYELKENLRKRLIPTIEIGDIDNLRATNGIIYNLIHFENNPNIASLEHINDMMKQSLSSYPSKEINFKIKCKNFLKSHRTVRHTLVAVTLGIGCYLVYVIGVNFASVSNNTAFITSVGLFGVLIGAYWHFIKK